MSTLTQLSSGVSFGGGVTPSLGPSILAPARKVLRVVRKTLPDGRVFQFVFSQSTQATPQGVFETLELVESPALSCSCTAASPDDVVCCHSCLADVCARRHSTTCMRCGHVNCSACLQAVNLDGVIAVVCRICAQELTASLVRKLLMGIRQAIWG